jgi:hypothetical protein
VTEARSRIGLTPTAHRTPAAQLRGHVNNQTEARSRIGLTPTAHRDPAAELRGQVNDR